MKKLLSLSFLCALTLASCDYVDNPYPESNSNIGDTTSCPTATFPAITAPVKKFLLEDFTGHTCGNCPWAAEKFYDVDTTYPGRFITLAIHTGSTFAAPAPGYSGSPSTAFLADYRTTIGDQYISTFDPEAIGLPQGMFSRKEYNPTTQTHLKFFPNFMTYASGIVGETAEVTLQMEIDYDAATRKICLSVKDSLITSRTDSLRLVVLLVQDSIIDWQDYKGTVMSNYVHRHILRDAITPTGAWGESLTLGTTAAGTKHINRFAYTIPAGYKYGASSTEIPCDDNQVHLIAFIYKTSNLEIIQAEEAKVIE